MKKIIPIILVAFVILFALKVNSVGVSSEYFTENPLIMSPGETKDIQITLQNMVGSEDVTLKGSITQGQDIATITDTNSVYLIPFGQKDIKVNIKVSIPAETQIGSSKDIIVSFLTVTPGDTTGTIRMGMGIDKLIPVKVQLKEQQNIKSPTQNYTGLIWGIIAIIILVIIFLLLRKKQTKKSQKNR